jgi:hypothetical protein
MLLCGKTTHGGYVVTTYGFKGPLICLFLIIFIAVIRSHGVNRSFIFLRHFAFISSFMWVTPQ